MVAWILLCTKKNKNAKNRCSIQQRFLLFVSCFITLFLSPQLDW